MSPCSQPRVFISYARKDGGALAQRLHSDLTNEGFLVWLDVERLTAGDVWRDEIEQAIDRSDVVVALLSAGSYVSDVCRVEQQQAREKAKPVIPVLVQSRCEIPDDLQSLQRLDFSNLNLYLPVLPQLIESIQKQAGLAVPPIRVARHNNAPALPENFVPRPQLLEALRTMLFSDAANRNIALTAMQGMGGIGKTVLARALCHDRVVQRAFPDGIFWFDIGKESQLSFSERMKGVPRLHNLLGEFEGEAACKSQYRNLLREKAALIVADDVWHTSDIEPFITESPRSRLLITTRDTSIGAWFGAREFTANLLTEAESRQVLANWCGRAVAELPPQASDVIQECGYLPLALAMVGAQLRGKRELLWNSVLEKLLNADLQEIKAQFPEPHTTLFRAIQISVDALDETARERYLALAVLLEDMAATPQAQRCIWGVDEMEASETAEQFVALSLAERQMPEGSIRLHDLQLDYARVHWSPENQNALDLIHGAIRLSSNVIENDAGQFASQIVGRLLGYSNHPYVQDFLTRVRMGASQNWLEPLLAALTMPASGLVRTLEGHTDPVTTAAITSDGQKIVSGGYKGIKIWDFNTGKLEKNYAAPGGVKFLALMLRGQVLVGCHDRTLKVLDLTTGALLRILEGHSDRVEVVMVTHDGRRAISGGHDKTLKIWDLDTGALLQSVQAHSSWVNSISEAPDGHVLSGSDDGTIKVWKLGNSEPVSIIDVHASVRTVLVVSDSNCVVSASYGEGLQLWSLTTGALVRRYKSDKYLIGAAIDVARRHVIAVSGDMSLQLMDLESGANLSTFKGHFSTVNSVSFTTDGRWIVSSSGGHPCPGDNTVRIWDASARLSSVADDYGHRVNQVAISRNPAWAIAACGDNAVRVWNLKNELLA